MLPVLSEDSEFGYGKVSEENLPDRRQAVQILTPADENLRARAKRIEPALVEKAWENEPYGDYLRVAAAVSARMQASAEGGSAAEGGTGVDWYRQCARIFLQRAFSSLAQISELSFDILDYDQQGEKAVLEKALEKYQRTGMQGMTNELRKTYDGFCAVRHVFEQHHKLGIKGIDAVVPVRYLPEVLVAAPVWFVRQKDAPERRPPAPRNPCVKHFCELVGTNQFAWLYQMYNRLPLKFKDFEGPDLMPPQVIDLIEQTEDLFDFLVIATPYHHLATKEWRNPSYQPNVDPFLFGFSHHVRDFAFFLARWSGSGLFPMVGDLIADTIEHIRENKQLLGNFLASTPWYAGKGESTWDTLPRLSGGNDNKTNALVHFADELLQHYDEGRLFKWLRAEPA